MRSILNRAAAALFLAVALTLATTGEGEAQAVNLTGTWLFDVTTDGGTGTPTVVIVQNGNALTGNYSSETLGLEANFTGTVDGSTFTITIPVDMQGAALTITMEGTIESAESVRGTYDLGGAAAGTFTGKPKPAA